MTQSNVVPINQTNGNLIIVVDGREVPVPLDQIGLTINTIEGEILEAVKGQLVEMNQPISDITELYKVHKAFDTGNIYVIPNSVSGFLN